MFIIIGETILFDLCAMYNVHVHVIVFNRLLGVTCEHVMETTGKNLTG